MKEQYEKNMAEQYNQYYQSGLYQSRYPDANPNVLSFIHTQLSLLPVRPDSQILDFGCGQGRYLLALSDTYNMHFIGYDISQRAIRDLQEYLVLSHQLRPKIQLFDQKIPLERHLENNQPLTLSLMLFGVLSHITKKKERLNTLKQQAKWLAPKTGRLLLSVPNRKRRFLFKQTLNLLRNMRFKQSERVKYQRHGGIQLNYHLYTLTQLKAELALAGFDVETCRAESILPEKWVLAHPLMARLDKCLCQWLPIEWAYGFLVLAKPSRRSDAKRH